MQTACTRVDANGVTHANKASNSLLETHDAWPDAQRGSMQTFVYCCDLGRCKIRRRHRNRHETASHSFCKGFAGTPTTVSPDATDFVTHAPAPTTASSSITNGCASVPLIM